MIDLYTHLLLNIGQGPKSEIVFAEIAKKLVEQGVTTAVVAPCNDGSGRMHRQNISTYVQQVNELLSSKFIPLHLIAAQEVMASSEIPIQYANHQLMTVNDNDKYLYLRLPPSGFQFDIETLVYDLQLSGLIPVFLHPEKYPSFQENTNSLYKIAKQGACHLQKAVYFLRSAIDIRQYVRMNINHFISLPAFCIALFYDEFWCETMYSSRHLPPRTPENRVLSCSPLN